MIENMYWLWKYSCVSENTKYSSYLLEYFCDYIFTFYYASAILNMTMSSAFSALEFIVTLSVPTFKIFKTSPAVP